MTNFRVVIQPFCSQQDKETQRFLLDADVTTQISRFLAESLKKEGAQVCLSLPEPSQCTYPAWTRQFEISPAYTPTGNRNQRLMFDPIGMLATLDACDLFITHNELITFKVRQIANPKLKIVHFNHLLPVGDWQWMRPLQLASWEAADLVVFLAPSLRRFAQVSAESHNHSRAMNMTVWPMVYDERYIRPREPKSPGNVDLLFVQRCSSNNYTHHREFIEAIKILRHEYNWKGRVVFTDPTRYLELHWHHELRTIQPKDLGIAFAHCETRQDYYELLHQTKTAIAMMTQDLHGGVAIREVIATGCLPVLLNEPCYETMLGGYAMNWPFLVPKPVEPSEIARVTYSALSIQGQWQGGGQLDTLGLGIRSQIGEESYQKAWQQKVKQDLAVLVGR